MDDWGVEGEDRVPSHAPSPPQAWTACWHLIFKKNPPGAVLLSESARNRMVATAAQCLPAAVSPDALMYKRSSASMYLARGTKRPAITLSQTRFGKELEARNRSRVREPDTPSLSYPRPHHRSEVIDRPRLWAPQPRASTIQTLPSNPQHRAAQPPRHTEPHDHRASRYILEHPTRNRLYEAPRPQAPTAAPLNDSTGAYKDYRKHPTPLPARSRHPPVHNISDSNIVGCRDPPSLSYLPPRKAPRRTEDAFPGHHERSAPEFPEPLHGHYESKEASTYTSEPQPSTSRDQTCAWPPTPRDFDNDRAESLASANDEPDY